MTSWGALLLVLYVALGLSTTGRGKAFVLAVGCTTLVLAAVLVRVVGWRTTPTE